MRDVVIVEAVRTPGRAPQRRAVRHAPRRPAGRGAAGGRRALGHRPGRGRPGRRRLRQPGRHAGLQHHPHRVAAGRACRSRPRHHRRHPVRLVAAGHQPRHRARRGGRRRRRRGLRRRGDERGADGLDRPEGPVRRQADQHALLGALREHLAVRGRRAHRREVGRHPRRARRFGMQSQDRAAAAWAEGRFDTQIVPDRRADARRAAASPPAPTPSTATRACATRRSRRSPT